MIFSAYHLPGFAAVNNAWTLERDGVRATAPRLTADDVHHICARLRDARVKLASLPLQRIIETVDETARRLRDHNGPGYADLIRGIATFTGYHPAMAAHVLERMSADWLAQPLERLVHYELGGAAAVDGFIERDGKRTRAVAPPLTWHVFSGNVPGVNVTSIVRALLVKSAVLGKSAAGEPLLAARFAQLLAEIDPVIGACLAITYWSGGTTDVESAALEHADAVIYYGAASAIASLRARAPARVRFIEHGPRLSFAVVSGDQVEDAEQNAARDLARAVALFDQQGCVSPQMAYVVSKDATVAHRFAARVAAALDDAQREFPRGRIHPGEAAAVRELRTSAEFRAIRGDHVALWSGDGLTWTVVLDNTPEPTRSCLNRTLIVRHVPAVQDVIDTARPIGELMQTVGVAGFEDAELLQLATGLADAGATRIAPLADMPWPPVTWHHDGRGPLRELIRWCDLEP